MHTPRHPLRRLALILLALASLGALSGVQALSAQPEGELAQNRVTGRRLYLPVLINGQQATIPPANIDVDLSIRPVPQSQVQVGSVLSVEYRFQNRSATGTTARFSLFYPQRLINFDRLDAPNDRLISQDSTRVVVEVRNVAGGQTRSGRINFNVRSNAAIGSRIGLYAEYTCRAGVNCQSNFAEVEVIRGGDEGCSGCSYTMSVSPDRGSPGTTHTFSGSRFRPGESFVTWLNTPSGVQGLSITGRADSSGNIRFSFATGGLGAGFYSMVAHGQSSNIQNVAPFIVQVNGQPGSLTLAQAQALARSAPTAARPALSVAAAPAQSEGDGGISGKLVDGAGAAVAGALVEVVNADGDLLAVATSNASGAYLVPTGLATGLYTVTAKPASNPALALLGEVSVGAISVTAPELTSGVNLTLPAAGGLAGTVTAEGAAVAGVRVTVLDGANNVLAGDFTDATGTYTVSNLPAGSYSLAFDPQATARAGIYAEGLVAGQTVTAGQVTTVAPFALTASTSTGVIAGKVSDATSTAGIEEVLVVITRAGQANGDTFVSIAETAADGTYTSDPLPPDNYSLQFVTLFSDVVTTTRYIGEFYNDAATFAEADAVTVTAGATTTADAGLAAGGSIAGTVTGSGAGALAEVVVLAFDANGVVRGYDSSDATGAYSLAGLRPGDYTVEFVAGLSPNSATRAYYDAFYDTTPLTPDATPVTVGAGAAVTGIDVTLSPGAQIVGTVSAGDSGAPLAEVIVAFIEEPVGGEASLAGLDLTDANGQYSSPALAPGRYKVLYTTILSPNAVSRSYQDEFLNNAATLAEATAVTVGKALAPITFNVELSPGGTVSGRVSALDSEAGLGGVFVVARVGGNIVGGTITDEAGAYSIEGLPAGTVNLSFDPDFSSDPITRSYTDNTLDVSVTIGVEADGDVVLTPEP